MHGASWLFIANIIKKVCKVIWLAQILPKAYNGHAIQVFHIALRSSGSPKHNSFIAVSSSDGYTAKIGSKSLFLKNV